MAQNRLKRQPDTPTGATTTMATAWFATATAKVLMRRVRSVPASKASLQ
ncbi:MAG TPA: hypothetical protein VGB68_01670 [Pyrinomonadaceae bacterium]